MTEYRMAEAADLLGVSDDTLRRWQQQGRFETTTTGSGVAAIAGARARPSRRRGVGVAGPRPDVRRAPATGCAASSQGHQGQRHGPGRDVLRPYRVVSLISREAADDLALEPGSLAWATVKSTNVSIDMAP